MPDFPTAQAGARSVATLETPRVQSTPRALGIILTAVMIAVTISGLLMFTLVAR